MREAGLLLGVKVKEDWKFSSGQEQDHKGNRYSWRPWTQWDPNNACHPSPESGSRTQ